MTAKVKAVNYTDEQTAAMKADYLAGVSVDTIAMTIGKTPRSVVAKLSREGVYKAKERTTKAGAPIVRKDATADAIGMIVGLSETEVESLTKANKTALVKILDIVKDKALSADVVN
jgi:hypothetical protein